MVKFDVRVGTWDAFPTPNFAKTLKGIYPFGINVYQKLPILRI